MTDLNLSYTPEDIFDEITARCLEAGVASQNAFDGMIEEVIENHRSVGEMHDDSGTEDMEEQMRGRWSDYQEILNGLNQS